MKAPDTYLPVAVLAAGVVLLAAEVRRSSVERDKARQQFENLVGRLAERPTTVLVSPESMPTVSNERTYVSDLPYDDNTWDEFVQANELLPAEDTA